MSLVLPQDRCFVIAEAGTNHAADIPEARLPRALDYVDAAAYAGADAIKFQWFSDDAANVAFPLPGDELRRPRWARSSMALDQWYEVRNFARAKGLVLLASAFEYTTIKWIAALDLPATKVASRAVAEFPYDGSPKPYLISLGMSGPVSFIDNAIYLECESKYPSTLRWQGTHPGFSDHSGTPWRAIDAIWRGCRIVEVHYHLDERDAGPDLAASLTLDELKLVCAARDAFAELRRQA